MTRDEQVTKIVEAKILELQNERDNQPEHNDLIDIQLAHLQVIYGLLTDDEYLNKISKYYIKDNI